MELKITANKALGYNDDYIKNRDKNAQRWLNELSDLIEREAKAGYYHLAVDIPCASVDDLLDIVGAIQQQGFSVKYTTQHLIISWNID